MSLNFLVASVSVCGQHCAVELPVHSALLASIQFFSLAQHISCWIYAADPELKNWTWSGSHHAHLLKFRELEPQEFKIIFNWTIFMYTYGLPSHTSVQALQAPIWDPPVPSVWLLTLLWLKSRHFSLSPVSLAAAGDRKVPLEPCVRVLERFKNQANFLFLSSLHHLLRKGENSSRKLLHSEDQHIIYSY